MRAWITGGILALIAVSLIAARPIRAERHEQVAYVDLSGLYSDPADDPGRRKPGPRIRHVNGFTIIDTRAVGAPSPVGGWCIHATGNVITPCY